MVNPPEDQGDSDQPGEEDFCLWAHLVQNDSRQYQPNDVFEMVGCSHLSDRRKEEIRQDFDEAVARIHEGKNEKSLNNGSRQLTCSACSFAGLRKQNIILGQAPFPLCEFWLSRWVRKLLQPSSTPVAQFGHAYKEGCKGEYQKKEMNSDKFSLHRNTKVLSATIAFSWRMPSLLGLLGQWERSECDQEKAKPKVPE
eukprot:scaffold7351_cov74-Cylindrotheca_fusiformis.AAC.2